MGYKWIFEITPFSIFISNQCRLQPRKPLRLHTVWKPAAATESAETEAVQGPMAGCPSPKQSRAYKQSFPQLHSFLLWCHVAFWTRNTLFSLHGEAPTLQACFSKQTEPLWKQLFICFKLTLHLSCTNVPLFSLLTVALLCFLAKQISKVNYGTGCLTKIPGLKWDCDPFVSFTTVVMRFQMFDSHKYRTRPDVAAVCPETTEICVYYHVISFAGGNYTSSASLWWKSWR